MGHVLAGDSIRSLVSGADTDSQALSAGPVRRLDGLCLIVIESERRIEHKQIKLHEFTICPLWVIPAIQYTEITSHQCPLLPWLGSQAGQGTARFKRTQIVAVSGFVQLDEAL